MNDFVVCLTAFSITALLSWVLRPLALRIGLVDYPGERKRHLGNIALVGGIAMFCGLMFSVVMLDASLSGFRAFFTAAALLMIVGILDDFRELPTWVRLGAQLVAALLMTLWGGVVVTDLGALTGSGKVELGVWAVPFTVFATVGVINAMNMVDGVDGLAGGVASVALSLLAWVAFSGGRYTEATVLLLLVCTVVAFLLFNARLPGRKHALVFMGDAGSMFLGFTLAWFAVSLSQGGDKAMTPVTALWIVGVPLIDAASIVIRRTISGRLVFTAALDHFHHLLLDSGRDANMTVCIILSMTTVAGLTGVIALYAGMHESLLFAGFLLLGFSHLWNLGRLARLVARDAEPEKTAGNISGSTRYGPRVG